MVSLLKRTLDGEAIEDTTAGEVMSSPVHTLSQSSCMGEVIQVLEDRKFRRVPIVDDKSLLVGIVDLTDLQAAMNGALERRGRDLEVAVMARTSELLAANAKLEQLSLRDGLTGLLNRRADSKQNRRTENPPPAIADLRLPHGLPRLHTGVLGPIRLSRHMGQCGRAC